MSSSFDQFHEALAEAKRIDAASASNADEMARLILPHLRRVNSYTLAQIKSELRFFNKQTHKWRQPK